MSTYYYRDLDSVLLPSFIKPVVVGSILVSSSLSDETFIMLTCPCMVPLTPHFYIVKLGFTGVYIIFLFLL